MNACIFFSLISEEMICSSRLKSKQPYVLTKKKPNTNSKKISQKECAAKYVCVCSQECQKIGAKKSLIK